MNTVAELTIKYITTTFTDTNLIPENQILYLEDFRYNFNTKTYDNPNIPITLKELPLCFRKATHYSSFIKHYRKHRNNFEANPVLYLCCCLNQLADNIPSKKFILPK